jgi:hypothetical protein
VLILETKQIPPSPICIHPRSPKYFLFRGKPLVLISATEHYGSVVNRPFDFERYLADAADKKQTLTRTFLLFREQQSSRNPSSPIKPESPDYIAPWPRTGPGKALDGEPIYDLDQWNGEYFERLHKFLRRASELGIVVELTLLSNTYGDAVWALNPLRAANNKQRVGDVPHLDYMTLKNKALFERQLAYVEKIVRETSAYDNIYYEICNEPGTLNPSLVSSTEIDAWQAEIAKAVRGELARLGRTHLVFGSQAFALPGRLEQKLDESFSGSLFDVVNVHPQNGQVLGGRGHRLGGFMSKELTLADLADFCRMTQQFNKPCVNDEDNAASLYRDDDGWTIHRKRAWVAVMSQTHYDYIDFSITVGSETGTRESNRKLRTWMKHLSEFIHSFDFIAAKPLPGWIETKPEHLVEAVLAKPGCEIIAYLADGRELTDPGAGQPIGGEISFRLPSGKHRVAFYSPTTGQYSPSWQVSGGSDPIRLNLPPLEQDLALRVTRVE